MNSCDTCFWSCRGFPIFWKRYCFNPKVSRNKKLSLDKARTGVVRSFGRDVMFRVATCPHWELFKLKDSFIPELPPSCLHEAPPRNNKEKETNNEN